MQDEERTEDRGEHGQLGEESRKRKRGAKKSKKLDLRQSNCSNGEEFEGQGLHC